MQKPEVEEENLLSEIPLPEARPALETVTIAKPVVEEEKPVARSRREKEKDKEDFAIVKPERSLFGDLFKGKSGGSGTGWPGRGTRVAIYDVSNATVYMPDGTKLRGRKIVELPDGSLLGCAGDGRTILKVQRWLEAGAPKRGKPRSTDAFEAILVRPDGTAHVPNEVLEFEPILDECFAIGTGGPYARMAMRLGKTAAEAIELASEFDSNTSAPVEAFKLKKKPKESALGAA